MSPSSGCQFMSLIPYNNQMKQNIFVDVIHVLIQSKHRLEHTHLLTNPKAFLIMSNVISPRMTESNIRPHNDAHSSSPSSSH